MEKFNRADDVSFVLDEERSCSRETVGEVSGSKDETEALQDFERGSVFCGGGKPAVFHRRSRAVASVSEAKTMSEFQSAKIKRRSV